jgi:Bacteriophage Lambda NinG protein.
MAMNKIEKECAVCGKSFVPKTVESIYCSKTCGNAAYRKKKAQQKKEEEQKAFVDKISADRLYISVPEAIALYKHIGRSEKDSMGKDYPILHLSL